MDATMKRTLALILTLCLALTALPALAETAAPDSETDGSQQEVATNPYSLTSTEATINLPAGLTVTNEEATEDSITLTLAMDGRTDVGFTVNLSKNAAYEGYTTATLPDDLLKQMVDYYSANYSGAQAPGVVASDPDDPMAFAAPLTAGGKGADGNTYSIYVMVLNGYVLTVSGGIAADEFDLESYGMVYNLYWQAVEMITSYFMEE